MHQPWTATPLELADAGIALGKTYPEGWANRSIPFNNLRIGYRCGFDNPGGCYGRR
jgi:hypothetical protein